MRRAAYLGILVLGSLEKDESNLLRRSSDDKLPLDEDPLGLQALGVDSFAGQSSIISHNEHGTLVMAVVKPLVVEERCKCVDSNRGKVGSALKSSAGEATGGDNVRVGTGMDGGVGLICE